ncbi:MAG: hypothetical protein ACRDQU_07630 [Pseudonocardiaceae bacterium]
MRGIVGRDQDLVCTSGAHRSLSPDRAALLFVVSPALGTPDGAAALAGPRKLGRPEDWIGVHRWCTPMLDEAAPSRHAGTIKLGARTGRRW